MASKKNDFFTISPSFFSQLIFGSFLILILTLTGSPLSLSIFLGVIAGFTLGWITNTSKNSPQPPTVASSDGIDAGLKYWLFFLVGFVFLGYSAPMSILLGGIAAIGGGWMISWWGSKEAAKTQLPVETSEAAEGEQSNERITKQQKRRPVRRFRRTRGNFNLQFWKK
ncbi:hypothetical protein JMG10_39965 [Nostoc ellipsosporum NOK]|nr:hypothetical protein [Nostoc ellipsosporum NOK]BAZ52548.1 hypothetical protein NIES4103_52120 [Nostoc sp. NIES-4103]